MDATGWQVEHFSKWGLRVLDACPAEGGPMTRFRSTAFYIGTSIMLSATHGRDVILSGVCSSGGNKSRTCTFTLNGNASVTANVQ